MAIVMAVVIVIVIMVMLCGDLRRAHVCAGQHVEELFSSPTRADDVYAGDV